MPNCSKNDIILVRYPYSDLSSSKIRPAVVISASHPSQDILITPLTSRTTSILAGEFALKDWSAAGLNVPTAIKRGIYTVQKNLVLRIIGQLSTTDTQQLQNSLILWLGLP
jgi:mRNA interferase MazF